MEKYNIKRIKDIELNNINFWNDIEKVNIDIYPWEENEYKPLTEVKLVYSYTRFYINFKVYEKKVETKYNNMNDPVYKDSAVEFFFNPNPEHDNRYLNFEINSSGALLLGIGSSREDRVIINEEIFDEFNIKTTVYECIEADCDKEYWKVTFEIPFNFIENYYGRVDFKCGKIVKGNFYKCGDQTKFPHFGCWSRIETPYPDFHRPEFFGELILQ